MIRWDRGGASGLDDDSIEESRRHFGAGLHSPLVQQATTVSGGDEEGERLSIPPGDLEDQRLFTSIHGRLFGGAQTLRLGRFRVEERLGAGAMGEVFSAFDPELDRPVALKLVHAHLADERHARRLKREAKALARLAHPNVVAIYEVGTHEGRVYLAMEKVSGQDLRTWTEEQKPSWEAVLGAYLQAGQGLAAAHRAGLTHRDFKPDNVLRGDEGQIKVADFGLASLEHAEREVTQVGDSGSSSMSSEAPLSRTGELKGTPAYMAPEQLRGESVDERADQFALCVSVYEGLWGRRPFVEKSLATLIESIADGPHAPGSEGVPAGVWPVLARGLAHAADERWPSVDALLRALQRAAEAPLRRRRRALAGVTIAAVAGTAAVAGAMIWSGPPSCDSMRDELASIWGPEAHGTMERGFEVVGAPWSADAATRTIGALDGWSERFGQVGVELCEAGRVDEDRLMQARRSACLQQRRGQFEALVRVLEGAEPNTLRKARAAVAQLDEPRDCLDDPSVLVLAPAPPQAVRETVGRLDRRLDDAEAFVRTAEFSRALEVVEAIDGAVKETEYDPLRARLGELRGRALLWSAPHEEHAVGVEALLAAADLAEGSRDDARLVESWRYLATYALSIARDAERGATWLRRAEAAARRLGIDTETSGELALLRGHRYQLEQKPDLAEAELRAAVDELDRRGRSLRLINALVSLGGLLAEQGQPSKAAESLERALAEAEQSYGPHHPVYGSIAYDLGAALLSLGRGEDAQARLDTAIATWSQWHGQPHPNLGMAHILRASLELSAGRVDRAEAEMMAAETILRATVPAGHPDLGDLASAKAAVALDRNDFAGAEKALDEVVEIYRAQFGAEDPWLAKVTAERGWARLAQKKVDAAAEDFAAADLVLSASEELASMRNNALLGRAVVAAIRGRDAEALRWLNTVQMTDQDTNTRARQHLWSAIVQARLGNEAGARAHMAEAMSEVDEVRRMGLFDLLEITEPQLRALMPD